MLEKNLNSQSLIAGAVHGLGHRVTFTVDPAEALKLVASVHFELALFDPVTVDGDPRMVASRLKAVSVNSQLPLIGLVERKNTPGSLGVMDSKFFTSILPLPFTQQELASAIDACPLLHEASREPDLSALKVAFKGLEEVAAKMALDFLARYPKLLNEIRESIEANDAKALEENAHSLAGSLSNFRVERVLAVSRKLERIGASGELGSAKEVFSALQSELLLLEAALLKFTRRKAA